MSQDETPAQVETVNDALTDKIQRCKAELVRLTILRETTPIIILSQPIDRIRALAYPD